MFAPALVFMIALTMAFSKPSNSTSYDTKVENALLSRGCKRVHSTPPVNAVDPTLPSPPYGQELLSLAVGRGTQNYTCDMNSPTSSPTAQGALAVLYDALCASAHPNIFNLLPDIALQLSIPVHISDSVQPSDILGYQNLNVIGHHYFSDPTTPIFDISTNASSSHAIVKKVADSNAPDDSPMGQGSNTNGAVPWLFLTSTAGSTGDVKSIYRTGTAGGNPPKTCQNMPASFAIEYAAHYWFYG